MRPRPSLAWAVGGLTAAALAAGPWLWRPPSDPPASPPEPAGWPLLRTPDLLARPVAGQWRWARWAEWPDTVVLQFPDLESQGAALNRLAAWREKSAAPRDRLLDDLALATLIHGQGDSPALFYGGHDYRLRDVAAFFALAERQHLPLNPEEQHLRDQLRRQGWLTESAEGAAPEGRERVLISFTDLQTDNPRTRHDETVDGVRRHSVLLHELSHARFFLDPAYRQRCHWLWHQALSASEREQFRKRLGDAGYDGEQLELLINETQALLLHTADSRAFQPATFGLSPTRVETLRRQFEQGGDPHGTQRGP